MTQPIGVDAVRTYISLDVAATSRYNDATLGSNIRAAASWMERHSHRWLWDRPDETFRASSNGQAYVTIPGLRESSEIVQSEATLTVDETTWLVPDPLNTGLYTGIQLRSFDGGRGRDWYLSVPSWFDRNLDHPYWMQGNRGALPNDLSIRGSWGFEAGSEPEELLHVCKVLSAYFTKRPDAVLAGAISTPDGNVLDLSQFPVEVRAFLDVWTIQPMVMAGS